MSVVGAVGEVETPARQAVSAKRKKMFLGGVAGLGGVFALLVVVDMIQRSGVA